jgi:hypothetical protein
MHTGLKELLVVGPLHEARTAAACAIRGGGSSVAAVLRQTGENQPSTCTA